jgi:hypothetical protein
MKEIAEDTKSEKTFNVQWRQKIIVKMSILPNTI